MAKAAFSGTRVSIPHPDMVALRRAGMLNLGMDKSVAEKLTYAGIRPKGTATAAFKFYTWIAFGAFVLGLYWAFTSAWWWGVIGLIAMVVIWNGNKSGHANNLLDAAMDDAEFYERVRSLNGWNYQIEEDAAAKFMTAS